MGWWVTHLPVCASSQGRGQGVCMYMQCVVLGHEYTPVTIVSTTKEPTVTFKGYSQLYKRKSEWAVGHLSLCALLRCCQLKEGSLFGEVPTCMTHTKYSKYSLM